MTSDLPVSTLVLAAALVALGAVCALLIVERVRPSQRARGREAPNAEGVSPPKRSNVDQNALLRTYSAELERQNETLRQMQAQLAQSEKMASLGALAAGVAHEINNPIGALDSNVQVVDRSLSRLRDLIEAPEAPDPRAALRLIDGARSLTATSRDAARRIAKIVVSLKTFAHLDEAERQLVDLHDGIESTLTLLGHQLGSRIEVSFERGELPRVECFPSELNQAFMKVLSNAIEAIDERGRISIRTSLRLADDGSTDVDRVRIEIADTGRGMSKTTLDRAFDPGFTTKGVRVGTGLGLSITQRVMQRHGGEVRAFSQPGRGSTFVLELPTRLPRVEQT